MFLRSLNLEIVNAKAETKRKFVLCFAFVFASINRNEKKKAKMLVCFFVNVNKLY